MTFCLALVGDVVLDTDMERQVTFTVLIESTSVFPDQPWEAIVWHNGHDGRQWRELAMREVAGGTSPVRMTTLSPRHDFRGERSLFKRRAQN